MHRLVPTEGRGRIFQLIVNNIGTVKELGVSRAKLVGGFLELEPRLYSLVRRTSHAP